MTFSTWHGVMEGAYQGTGSLASVMYFMTYQILVRLLCVDVRTV